MNDECEGPGECSDWCCYESGPYCGHWDDPGTCMEMCKCGHACKWHVYDCDECDCEGFTEGDCSVCGCLDD